ncbi:MAG: RsmD family RNA methyltransferase [bacterium]
MVPEDSDVRPTKSVVVRAIRDMLRPIIHETVVVDLFAGTGRVGKALLDEGARKAIGVDRSDPLEELPVSYNWIKRDVEDFVSEGPGQPVDVVFMDPPYGSQYPVELLTELQQVDWLKDRGIIIIETARSFELPDRIGEEDPLYLMRKRNYGGSRLWLYQFGRSQPGYQE